MSTLFDIKSVQDDGFEVQYEVVSIEEPYVDARRRIINENIIEIDKKLDKLQTSLDELETEIDNLTNHADGLDYAVAVVSGILTGLIDSFFVGELGLFNNASDDAKDKFNKAKGESNEIVNKFVEKYAKIRAGLKGESSKVKDLKSAIKYLEDNFIVAQDNTWSGKGISSSRTHHLDDLAHHPTLMGLISAILVQFFRISIFASKDGKVHPRPVETSMKDLACWIPVVISGVLKWIGYMAEKKDIIKIDEEIPEPIKWIIKNVHKIPIILQLVNVADNWFAHLVSDMGGSKSTAGGGAGVPGLFISLLKEISMLPGIKDTDLPQIVNDLYASKKKYTTSKVDLRTEIAVVKQQALPVIINEVIVRTFYFVRRLILEYEEHNSLKEINWRKVIPLGNRTVIRMMTIASGTFVAFDVMDAAIRSGGFNATCLLRVNFVGIGRFAIAIVTDVSMGVKKGRKEKERRELLTQIINTTQVKLYYKKADMLCSMSDMYAKEAEMYEAESDMWIAVQETQRSIDELYEQTEIVISHYKNVTQDIRDRQINIGKKIVAVEEKNPGMMDEILRRLRR